ncbi:MAG: 50S ribosomal protein L15 [Candidatus Nealsonbacteria bacterium CG23_combo_of_CG06-09_8_20_14_all_36_12]|uniref:Large ribosomal subunit protein uL15 n=2 Tax=Candidatus Nealsoniibacteriota TaxID=1817911 RepID=A0A2H0TN82_9BACT|nr:MAG: 50S ribosomal protein L15 [Candidatus Nealsonbacteria bacterium CG23_combo_of_CG06-09_8_20_14_all_36_12]PIR72877.1 MAG: 50S ribosomal protein L15 [Candidatus Nealsonbacteria bacterium CG10_big_fil_rev_8_21_14_0_10_36_23]
MQLHELKPIHKLKRKKRIGRGGKRGTYSGRGIKGQKARAGRRLKPVIRDLIKRYPKLRGYKFKSKVKSQKSKLAILNTETLEKKFKTGEKVSPKILIEKRLIRRIKGRIPKVKILGRHPPTTRGALREGGGRVGVPQKRAPGKLTKKLIIEGCQVSKSAREEIEKAQGIIRK